MTADDPRTWQQKGMSLIGSALFIVVAAGLGIYTVITSVRTTVHQNIADVPSVTHVDASPQWANAVALGRQASRSGLVDQNLPGLSVAVGIDGAIVWAEGFGWADIERKLPVAPNLRFRMGHASTALTSAAIGLLVESGRLDLDHDVQRYVPAFPEKDWTITLRQIMGHVSGIRHYDDDAEYMPTAHCERAAEGLGSFKDDALRFQPESEFSYSTFGWVLASAAIEAAAQQPFVTFMQARVFQPLGMRDTTTDSVSDAIPNRVTFYHPRFNGDTAIGPELAATVDYSCFAGAGAFLTTPSDLVRFGVAMSGGTLLKPATVKALLTPQQLLSGEETGFGLGWTVEELSLAGEPTLLASVSNRTLIGGSTSLLVFPERAIAVAVMSNTASASLRPVAMRIAQAFAEQRGTK